MIDLSLLYRFIKGVAKTTKVVAKLAIQPLFGAVTFRSGWDNRNIDERN